MKRGKTNGKKIKRWKMFIFWFIYVIKLVCAHQHLRSLLAFHREPARKKNGECTTIEIARFQINYLEKIFLALKCWSFFSPFPTKITIFNANFMRYSQFFLFHFVFFFALRVLLFLWQLVEILNFQSNKAQHIRLFFVFLIFFSFVWFRFFRVKW